MDIYAVKAKGGKSCEGCKGFAECGYPEQIDKKELRRRTKGFVGCVMGVKGDCGAEVKAYYACKDCPNYPYCESPKEICDGRERLVSDGGCWQSVEDDLGIPLYDHLHGGMLAPLDMMGGEAKFVGCSECGGMISGCPRAAKAFMDCFICEDFGVCEDDCDGVAAKMGSQGADCLVLCVAVDKEVPPCAQCVLHGEECPTAFSFNKEAFEGYPDKLAGCCAEYGRAKCGAKLHLLTKCKGCLTYEYCPNPKQVDESREEARKANLDRSDGCWQKSGTPLFHLDGRVNALLTQGDKPRFVRCKRCPINCANKHRGFKVVR